MNRIRAASVFFSSILILLSISRASDAAGHAQLAYDGYGPQNFAQIYQDDWAVSKVTLSGDLFLPKGDGPFPVVVLQHGSGAPVNLQSWWDYVVPALLAEGIGAFIADSYGGRGIGGTAGDQRKLSKAARVVDALMALKALSAQPKVDAGRIGITGYSFGGIVAMETADRRTVEAVLGKDLRFAAHLPVYPSCGAHRAKIDMTGAPMLFLVGADDNYTPARFCQSYVPKLQQAGVAASLKVYPDAGHLFVRIIDTYAANAATFNGCGTSIINEDGYNVIGDLSEKGLTWAQFVVAAFRKCGARGANLYGTRQSREQARDDTVAFFKKTLRPN